MFTTVYSQVFFHPAERTGATQGVKHLSNVRRIYKRFCTHNFSIERVSRLVMFSNSLMKCYDKEVRV